VDEMLTEALGDLGIAPEEFMESLTEIQGDQITTFVIQTILSADDFLLFKSMMVKRNLELDMQVLGCVYQVAMVLHAWYLRTVLPKV
jgi:The ARF-like 2 binding protein BART